MVGNTCVAILTLYSPAMAQASSLAGHCTPPVDTWIPDGQGHDCAVLVGGGHGAGSGGPAGQGKLEVGIKEGQEAQA